MASSRFCDTWRAVRQKMSFPPFHGMWAGEVAPRPRPGSRARNSCCDRGSSRDGVGANGCDGRGGGSVREAASARALVMINSELKKVGWVSAWRIFGKVFLKRGKRRAGKRAAQTTLANITLRKLQSSLREYRLPRKQIHTLVLNGLSVL